jgi:predicted N-acetyltransferase YhbS
VSEFYAQRRTSIKDGVALVAFILGWFASAPFAWHYIADAFDNGDPAKGVLRFLLVVFIGGVAFGAVGLVLGHAAGFVWERWHLRWRRTHAPIDRDEVDRPAVVPPPRAARLPLPALRIERADIDVEEFRRLLQRAGVEVQDAGRVGVALQASITIGAWHDDRLIGVARIVTDCAVTATLAELAVDPEYQHRGLGRTLLARAYDATPRGELNIIAPRGTGPFFEALGADRALASFVLRRAVHSTSA